MSKFEVHERHMDQERSQRLQPTPSQVTHETAAELEGSRAILGCQDPKYDARTAHGPTTTRNGTGQLMLQHAACPKLKCWEGDVSAAFLQRRECTEDMYCAPTKDLCEAMQSPKEITAKPRKSCSGLVQPPFEWYESVRERSRVRSAQDTCQKHFVSLGFRQSCADPCWIVLKDGAGNAIMSGSVPGRFRWGTFKG